MKNIRIAIAGIGNCASALIQGVEYYKNTDDEPIGVMPELGGYTIPNLEFVVGFDVHKDKVGKSLGESIFVAPNCVEFLHNADSQTGQVLKGEVLDGLDSAIGEFVPTDQSQQPVDLEEVFRKYEIDVLIILLPTGSQKAAEYYARAAIAAGCAVVNGMPAAIANNEELIKQAEDKKVPIIGDDIKSQIGATITHRALTNLFPIRHAIVDRTIQLDWGGDMDFRNLTSNQRYDTGGKRRSKTEAVIDGLPNRDTIEAHVSAVDYIPFLKNQKEAYTRIEGRIFGGKSVRLDLMIQVQDAYNSAGILVDALRVAMVGKQRSVGGVIHSAASLFNKRPPKQLPDTLANERLQKFLNGELDN
ncbi:inositol-3-phosphate synthase [Kordiimonas marina]|uniref:inositol-3-phosphate synthase n=1 Tax=Kordiimonas marina TaxID=2872312 RepID=UPI001FF50795|nr:inositol-3-phosphate synthase [Kordiimonas marina]MCJ9430744.1 inositol-3-phosphate synthase [Kordiimonas marina]